MPAFSLCEMWTKGTHPLWLNGKLFPNVADAPASFCYHTSASGVCFMVWRKLPVDSEGSCGLQACWRVGAVTARLPVWLLRPSGDPVGGGGGRRGRMKSTLVHATPRLEWPYVRFSDTGQLPLNPAVWGTRSMMFASQGGLTGCTNEENCKVDSSKTKCQSVDFRAGSFWWIRATQMKLEGTWKSIDEYWATASPFQEHRTPLLAKGGKKKTLTFGKTSKNIHVNIQMCRFHCTVGHHRPPRA